MVIAINKLFAQLLFWLYELLDTIFEMFAVLCGIEALETADADVPRSLIEIFLESSAVTRAFLLIVIVSVVVAAVSTIVAIVKNIINMISGIPHPFAIPFQRVKLVFIQFLTVK